MPRITDVLIIGAGFGGLGLGIRLRQQGRTDFAILEQAADLGGTWRDNTYPGAACDVPSHLYSWSFAPASHWQRRFAEQPQILEYLRHCASEYGLTPHLHFDRTVTAARWDHRHQRWQVDTASGERWQCRVLVAATGQLNRPAWPQLPHQEDFQGERFHSARWDHGVDLRGKRVAVIGTGASAIQFVPAIMDRVASLTLFQRSAAWVLPKPDGPYDAAARDRFARQPWRQRLSRARLYTQYEFRVFGIGLAPVLLKAFEWRARRYLARSVQDPLKRRLLTPDYPIGCKRVLLSNDYLQALDQPRARIVTDGLEGFTSRGLRTRDGEEHQADVVIYGTGFQATGFLGPMQVSGRDGLSLQQAWQDGAEAFLGITVHGFPNLFLLYGPNTNLGHSSIVYMLESQYRYLLSALEQMDRRGGAAMEVRAQPQQQFNRRVQKALARTVWEDGCTSWYKTEGGRNTNNWPGFTFHYRHLTRKVDTDDYFFHPRP